MGFKKKMLEGTYQKRKKKKLITFAWSLAKKQYRLHWQWMWLLKQQNIFSHILSNNVLAFALSEVILRKKTWRLHSVSILPWENLREQCHNPVSILSIYKWQNGKCHHISEMNYFFLLLLVIPAWRHQGYGDDSFKPLFGVLAPLLSGKLMLVYLDNLGAPSSAMLVGPEATKD